MHYIVANKGIGLNDQCPIVGLQAHLGLLLGPGVLERDRSVEHEAFRSAVVVRREVAASYELQVVAGL